MNSRQRVYDPSVTDDERTWAMWIHMSLLAHIVLSIIAVVIPWAMWLAKKDRSAFIDDHGMEALNFQISIAVLSLLLIPVGLLTCGIGFFLYIPVYVLGLVGVIQASMAANRGEFYRYPMTFRFLN